MNTFKSINFKIAVINSLRKVGHFESEFEELIEKYWDEENFDYKPIAIIMKFCEELDLPKSLLKYVKEISFDGGNEIYHDIIPNWDGEDGYFKVDSIEDVLKLPNLETFVEISLLNVSDYSPLLELKKLAKAYHLSCDDKFLQKLIDKGIDVTTPKLEDGSEKDPFFIHFLKGEKYEQKRMLNEAISEYTKAIEVNFHELPFYRRGLVYKMLGKYEESLLDLNQALNIQPSYSSARSERGFVLYKLGKFHEALEDVNSAIDANNEYGFPEAEEYKNMIIKKIKVI